MKKRTLLGLFIMINIVISCVGDELNCPPSKPFFKINSIKSNNLVQTDTVYGYYESVALMDTIKQDNFFISVNASTEYYAKHSSINLGATLFAIDCDDYNGNGNAGTKEGIKNITIITLNDYNLTYKANDTITERSFFNAYSGYRVDFNEFINHSDFIIQNQTSITEESFNIKIFETIGQTNQKARFKIILELTNGDVFETATDEIVLKK